MRFRTKRSPSATAHSGSLWRSLMENMCSKSGHISYRRLPVVDHVSETFSIATCATTRPPGLFSRIDLSFRSLRKQIPRPARLTSLRRAKDVLLRGIRRATHEVRRSRQNK